MKVAVQHLVGPHAWVWSKLVTHLGLVSCEFIAKRENLVRDVAMFCASSKR